MKNILLTEEQFMQCVQFILNEGITLSNTRGFRKANTGQSKNKRTVVTAGGEGFKPTKKGFNMTPEAAKVIEDAREIFYPDIDSKIKNQKNASYILDDNGFTIVSNGKEPFFSVFPQPEEGYGHFFNDKDDLQKIFAALSHTDTMNALIYLYHKVENYVFESAVLQRDCEIANDQINAVIDDLLALKLIWKQELTINGEKRVLYYSRPSHKLLAVLLMTREIGYKGAYSLQSHIRNTPFIKE